MICLMANAVKAQTIGIGSDIKYKEQKEVWDALDDHFKSKDTPAPKEKPSPSPKETPSNNGDKGGNKNDGNNLQSYLIVNKELETI